jgi:anti-sigma B factor antagonist
MTNLQPDQPKWEIKQRQADSVTVVELIGQVELGGGADELEEKLQKLIADGHAAILLECSRVDTIDSSAVGALVRSYISLDKHGGTLKLLNISPVVRAAITLVGLSNTIEIFDDEAAAVASFL